jgi:hypothetical protein
LPFCNHLNDNWPNKNLKKHLFLIWLYFLKSISLWCMLVFVQNLKDFFFCTQYVSSKLLVDWVYRVYCELSRVIRPSFSFGCTAGGIGIWAKNIICTIFQPHQYSLCLMIKVWYTTFSTSFHAVVRSVSSRACGLEGCEVKQKVLAPAPTRVVQTVQLTNSHIKHPTEYNKCETQVYKSC